MSVNNFKLEKWDWKAGPCISTIKLHAKRGNQFIYHDTKLAGRYELISDNLLFTHIFVPIPPGMQIK